MNSKAIRKQLLAAVAMVLVAAVALGSSTYAWFVASGTVEATGMKVQAQAESGLLIRGVSYNSVNSKWEGGDWATSANAANAELVSLRPTSTVNLYDWYMASSNSADTALSGQTIDEENAPAPYTKVADTLISTYRRLDTFAIRSASGADLTDVKLAVKSVSATTEDGNTGALDESIRIGVRMHSSAAAPSKMNDGKNTQFYIFAPRFAGAGDAFELTATYANDTEVTEYKEASSARDFLEIKGDKIPYADTGVMVEVFTWYEGEDAQCKTANITNESGEALEADDLTITVVFEKVSTK